MDKKEIETLQNFFIDNEKYYCSETSQKITFEEKFRICDVDSSFVNQIPKSEFIKIKFFISDSDEELIGIETTEDIRRVNRGVYKQKETLLRALVTLNKKFFFHGTSSENGYLFYKTDSFLNFSDRLVWENLDEKMIIYILGSCIKTFESDFLIIKEFQSKNLSSNKVISSVAKSKFEDFNNIHNSTYEDKKLKSYFEYPLTWFNLENDDYLNELKCRMIDCFFKTICNKELEHGKYLIRGHKTIVLEVTKESIDVNTIDIVKEMFDFLLDVNKHHDKLILLRNTLTLFLDSESNSFDFIRKSDEILKTLKYNFNLYVQDKIKIFLDQKNKLLQEFVNTTKRIEDLTNSLISQIRSVALSLLGTILISLLGDVKNNTSLAIMNLVILCYTAYLGVNWILVFYQNKQKESYLNSLKNYTKELGAIGNQSENNLSYENLKEKYLDSSISIYMNYRCWIIVLLSILIVFFCLLFLSTRFNLFPEFKDLIKTVIGY